MTLYLDSSAVVKLVVQEPEAGALRRRLRQAREHTSSLLAQVEVLRAVLAAKPGSVGKCRQVLSEIALMDIDASIAEDAGTLTVTPPLRNLDAIHLASARKLGADLAAVITYDQRMTAAAEQLGLPVESPGVTWPA